MIVLHKPDIVCIQETKMAEVDDTIVRNSIVREYEGDYKFFPADGTRGGILVASKSTLLSLGDVHLTNNTISTLVTDERRNITWRLTVVYGPQGDMEKRCLSES